MSIKSPIDMPRLLVVEDDSLIGGLLARWLSDEGYPCSRAASADEAMIYLRKHDVALVTLDIRMPGVSGLQCLKKVKQEFPDTAVLMVTGEGDTSVAIEALTSGAHGFLQKPTEQAELIIQVKRALDHRRMTLENRQYNLRLAEKVREQTAVIMAAHKETVGRLIRASLYRDEETGSHIRRTGEYSELLAMRAGWSSDDAALIHLAAPLHDIGKIGIPDAILRKPGRLTAEEMAIMRTHTTIGAKMLSGSTLPMLQMAEEIALNHHEHWNGKGYPNHRTGFEIPESARIVAIVDVFDALSHDRVYRAAMSEDEVLEILREGRGQHFDPVLLDLFFEILPEIRNVVDNVPDDQFDGSDIGPLPVSAP